MQINARARLALPFVIAAVCSGCASPPTVSSRTIAARPAPVKNLFVMTPPAIYHGAGAGVGALSAGFDMEQLAQGLITVLSRRLNEAGNNTATTLVSRPGRSLADLVAERHKASGVSEALVVAPRRATFAGGIVRSLEVEAKLYDAASMTLLWEYKYETRFAANTITLDVVQDIIKSLRAGGFVA
jgi:hypothetical protein